MMKTDTRVAIVLLVGFVGMWIPAFAGPRLGVEVHEPEYKVLQAADDDGDIELAIKVTVKNTSETEVEVKLVVQGIDGEGFEVFDYYLSNAIKPGQTQLFTDTDFIKERRYKSIVRWRVEEVTVRPGHANNAVQPSRGASS